ncbi:hypothetical protein KCTC32516_00395 [Polaribacter huanghezhanensis]|uniref:hypothetical protein n=1 Tax=Polaribacter huanghezhanensis TaxID=1354726 RepID=UPI002648D6EA|nr:hypothetical protein [Polaribacter huanghezhanensis]WKD85057.1 hypothetical protein KCTC32516_00395 [Polaribacter huanghezhanensis]
MKKRKLILGFGALLFMFSIVLTIDSSEAIEREENLPTAEKCYNEAGEYTGQATKCDTGGTGCNINFC